MKQIKHYIFMTSVFIVLSNCFVLEAEGSSSEIKKYYLHSGEESSRLDDSKTERSYELTFRDTIVIPDAVWLKILFKNTYLGEKSYIIMKSLRDDDYQRLNTISMSQWQNSSGIFNGNAIEISLFKAKEDKGIFFEIEEVLAGQPEIMSIKAICDSVDDRVRIEDSRVGRLFRPEYHGGTTWLASNGALLTAGHSGSMGTAVQAHVEFNIPSSESDGTPVHAALDDQYAIDTTTRVFDRGFTGNDWAVFRCHPNSNTGLLPHQKQGEFFRMTNETPLIDEIIRITGCGVDYDPLINNKTVQTDTGEYRGEFLHSFYGYPYYYHRHRADTEGDNSGSPIIWEANSFAIGIHTHAGCDTLPSSANHGTSFKNIYLEDALQNLHGPNTVYVDWISQSPVEDGTIFSPYSSISEAIDAVPEGGNLFITTGVYNNCGSLLIDKAMTILPPAAGAVIINP